MKSGSALLVVAALLLAVPAASAQHKPSVPPPVLAPPAVPPPPPPLPSAPAALTVPNPFGGLIPGPRDLYQSRDGSDRFQHLNRHQRPPVIIGGGGYYPYPYYPDPSYMPGLDTFRPKEPPMVEPRGALSLLTTPQNAQVFVDGFYVGIVEEFGSSGRPMSVTAGAHRIDLRAPGYETLSFNIMIEPNDIVRYRGEMQLVQTGPAAPAAPAAAPPAPPRAAKTYYVIPKCYAGDRPPRGPLPAGCDRKNLQTYR